MARDRDEAARAIRGCLEYLLMDAEEAKLERVAKLLRVTIGELAWLRDRDDDEAEGPRRPILPD